MQNSVSFDDLRLDNIGNLPQKYQIGFCVLAGIFLVALVWWFHVRGKITQLERLEGQEVTLRQEFDQKQGEVANLEELQLQLTQMEGQLEHMLRQLPGKTEMPDLIVDISQTALASGISAELFRPGQEITREFYAETPIELRMQASYHQFADFVSRVASLPRIVIMTMYDFSLKPADPNAIGLRVDIPLELSGSVRTYRHLDDEELLSNDEGLTAGDEGR